ncbi:membrane protein DedA with SNARE-associated domain [Conyzicola lurida]|uniref:Membrane protein DedA with SNARE-associated domain n=1 Tax=Conyzicola lurida TaxID=1172621 RepID=A0A841AIM8_9MICO|nr:VTT domain-containing protein [Conyzicola lurida]MBB5843087.1 membrane protein DedA with SNARE-associated domain [Conyzicola lurida]
MDEFVDAALALADAPGIYAVVFAFTLLDAFLVIVPSETLVVALGALAMSTGSPSVWILVPVAAVAAVAGDSLTYVIGRGLRRRGTGWSRRPRVAAVLEWARTALDRRAAAVLLTARFVPFGRIAVNLTAGSTGFRYSRFLPLTAVAGVCWAGYNVAVGGFFGVWFSHNPALAVVLSVVVAVCAGVLLDRASAFVARR